MIKRVSQGLQFFQFETLSSPDLVQAIFTRHGGVSPAPWDSLNLGGTVGDEPERVAENLTRILNATGYEHSSLVQVYQVHSAEVILAERAIDGRPKGDAIITRTPGLLMLMRFADCVPIFLYDSVQKAAGIVHAGWQGTVKHVSREAVLAMVRHFNTNPADVIAGIGPSIGPDHYTVGEDVIGEVKTAFPENWEDLLVKTGDRVQLDLWKANEYSLREAGVNRVELAALCTGCNNGDWYSHRAENGKTGRFAAVLGVKEVTHG